ncbi:MAG: alkaline phosphatase [Oscillospiraceae bacterium]|nr:alkaline phosphatase [Oscillospiraceae bacterium]
MNFKRSLAAFLAAAAAMTAFAGCSSTAPSAAPAPASSVSASTPAAAPEKIKTPKYVFLFIGDGMSYPQFQAASDYLGAVAQDPSDEILKGGKTLSFMNFPVAGSAATFDSTSFCPDSASTATSISTGHKTHSGTINMNESKTQSYETIAEKLKKQLGFKIGIVSSVNLNHATPAAFYAHQASRNSYYEISEELVDSGFEYFAGGGLKQTTGADKDKTDSYEVAAAAGYKVIKTQAEAEALTSADGKAIIIGETLADSDSLSYDNDRADAEWSLRDYVKKGIEVLDNDAGFFMMVEGGKIDWACHANDAGSTIADTIAMADAVDEAIAFYNQHPDETLILVTGDHETGGLTIGYAGTDYDTFLTNLTNQKVSYAKFDADYVAGYKENSTPFADVLVDVKECFGLMTKDDSDATEESKLVLTDYELGLLEAAYAATMAPDSEEDPTQAEYVLYGSYEPLTVTITHLLNNKSGINFASYAHTGLPVAVFAQGAGQELFEGYYDNTQIYHKMAELLNVQ